MTPKPTAKAKNFLFGKLEKVPAEKQELRDKINKMTAEFIKTGGKIKRIK